MPRQRVVVVGGGFGGLAAVRALRDAPVDVILVDRHNYHLFQPLLYQVATALLDPSEIARPVRAVLRHNRHATFRLAAATGVDTARRRLHTDRGEIPYDRLVLAAGSATYHYGISGLGERAFGLKELGEALALRARIIEVFERADESGDADERRRLLSFAIVGAGPTGVEFAGALSELIRLVLRKDYPHIDLREVRVVLADAFDHILGPFAPPLRSAARRALEARGVSLRFAARVRDVRDDGLILEDGEHLRAATVVWTGGVRAVSLAGDLGVPAGSLGRILVDPATLRVPGHDDVYAIGDIAEVRAGREPLPMLAPVAIQEGQHVAERIRAELRDEKVAPFRYRDRGTMATVGRNFAIAQIGPLRLTGFLGWLAWLLIHLVLLIGFRSRVIVLVNWAWDYFLFDRPVRLITRVDYPSDVDGR